MNRFTKSSKRNKLFLVVALGIIIFVQCHWLFENEVYNPHEHPLLDTGDTLVFEGENAFDSLYVRESKVYKPYEYDGAVESEVFSCHIIRLNCVRQDTCLSLETTISENYYTLYYNYPFRYHPNPYSDSEFLSESINNEYTLSIGGNEITDLYFIEFDSQVELFKEIKSVLYSRTYGLVQYTNFKDEVFTLAEESLEMLMARE